MEEGSPSVRPFVRTSVRPTDRALCFESKYFLTSGSQMSYTVCAEYAPRTPKCRPSQLLLDMHTQSQSHNQRRTGKAEERERIRDWVEQVKLSKKKQRNWRQIVKPKRNVKSVQEVCKAKKRKQNFGIRATTQLTIIA